MNIGINKIKISALFVFVLCLLLINSAYIPQRTNNLIRLVIEIILLIGIITKFKISSKILKKSLPMFIFFIVMCISTYLNHGIGSRFFNMLVTGGAYLLFYFFVAVMSAKYSSEYIADLIRKNILIYMLILDFFVLVTWGNGLGGLDEAVYLFGNKFMVSYIHMIVLSFINFNTKKNYKIKVKVLRIIFFMIYSMIILKIADTTTGMVGCLIVSIILLASMKTNRIQEFFLKPSIVVIFFLCINVVFLLTDFVLNNSIFMRFLLSKSHTNTILSGRLVMYRITMEAIAQNPIWGYGLNYDIVQKTLSFGNAQNGILKLLLDYGVVGTFFFLVVLYSTFKNACDRDSTVKISCIAFIYGMLICSLVEINLAAIFMLICAIINGINEEGIKKKRGINVKVR